MPQGTRCAALNLRTLLKYGLTCVGGAGRGQMDPLGSLVARPNRRLNTVQRSTPIDQTARFSARPVPTISCPSGLVGASADDDRPRGAEDDLQIDQRGPVVDVEIFQHCAFIPAEVGAAANLPKSGHARLDQQAVPVGSAGRGPTRLRSPLMTFIRFGISSSEYRRMVCCNSLS